MKQIKTTPIWILAFALYSVGMYQHNMGLLLCGLFACSVMWILAMKHNKEVKKSGDVK